MDFQLREADLTDTEFLTSMLVEAAEWQPDAARDRAKVMSDPKVARYVDSWPRHGDYGLIAVCDGVLLGAAWLRLFTAEEPAYGFVAADVPELAIGVEKQYRGHGIGTVLLRELLAQAAASFARVSLSVDHDNPARSLYEREGFTTSEVRDSARTMVRSL